MTFNLISPYQPTGDQPRAIDQLTAGLAAGRKHQVLLGVTGSGKTFTMANVVARVQKPTLVISHNKTLAAQLYQEFKSYFPHNAVSYFVSYYDYYQPEAYLPQTDTYIEKETEINAEIDKLRLSATTNLLTRKDVIIVASVSCIYNLGSPADYSRSVLEIAAGVRVTRQQILLRLNDLQYARSDYGFRRGTYRVRGETVDVFPASEDTAVRIHCGDNKIDKIEGINPITGAVIAKNPQTPVAIYPAKHYISDRQKYPAVFAQINHDLEEHAARLTAQGKQLEAHRIRQRVRYDLEMISELGYVNGIENYSRYFDGRQPGDPPYSLLDYFPKDYLLIVDESHMTIPQIRGMYAGDRARKQTLIDFGFRLPAALDNRPLRFDEFLRRGHRAIYVSATPDEWEISQAEGVVVEQLIRPTGLVDPEVVIRPTAGQIAHLESEIVRRAAKGQRVLVTTLTKRMAEDLAEYLKDRDYKVHYLHSDVQTLERLDILDDLRQGVYDVVVGINLLREGLDLPEVSLVAILDADKEGFLRSKTALIQTMGRAARHAEGQVVMYADHVTDSMRSAIAEVNRRREVQMRYNANHQLTPQSIVKPFREKIVDKPTEPVITLDPLQIINNNRLTAAADVDLHRAGQLVPEDRTKLIKIMSRQMTAAAKELDFELAAKIRDRIRRIQSL